MSLLSQVAGALVAGGLVLLLAWQAGARGRQAAGAVALVPIAVAGMIALPNLRDAAASLLDQRRANVTLTADEAQVEGGVGLGLDVAFIRWAGEHFSKEDTFHLTIGGESDETAVRQWALFQLAPNLEAEEAADADWLIFYDAGPAAGGAGKPTGLDVYSPHFAVARGGRAR